MSTNERVVWPDEPQDTCQWGGQPVSIEGKLSALRSPYDASVPPFCYPGTNLTDGIAKRVARLIKLQINHIGTHTHSRPVEEGFEDTQQMEREAIWMLASVLGGSPEEVDGYFCGGGTEANDMGLWIGRQWLRQHPDPFGRGIAILCTPLAHFSIHQAAAKLDIGQSKWTMCPRCRREHVFVPDPSGAGVTLVGIDKDGQMDMGSLARTFELKYAEGFRRFLIVPTAGTTTMGSIDPIESIAAFAADVRRTRGAHCYVHVDASIGGFTVPFASVPDGKSRPKIAFDVPEVMSVAVDGDKMGQLPYPAGIFLCRKDLQLLVARQVMYMGSHEHDTYCHDTYCGSRTCLAPVLAWYQFQRHGQRGQRKYVQKCIAACDALDVALRSLTWVSVLPRSPYVNILPVELRVDPKRREVPKELCGPSSILGPYFLRSDHLPSDPSDPESCPRTVYKISVWSHVIPHRQRFVADLRRAKKEWDRQRLR